MEKSDVYKSIVGIEVHKQRLSSTKELNPNHFEINSEGSSIRMEPEVGVESNLEQEPAEESGENFVVWAKFVLVRLFVVFLVTIGSFGFKNVNILLAIGGSILGTAMTIVMPVVFYNRAFSSSAKHLSLDKTNKNFRD